VRAGTKEEGQRDQGHGDIETEGHRDRGTKNLERMLPIFAALGPGEVSRVCPDTRSGLRCFARGLDQFPAGEGFYGGAVGAAVFSGSRDMGFQDQRWVFRDSTEYVGGDAAEWNLEAPTPL
jgi:hypothetical protein